MNYYAARMAADARHHAEKEDIQSHTGVFILGEEEERKYYLDDFLKGRILLDFNTIFPWCSDQMKKQINDLWHRGKLKYKKESLFTPAPTRWFNYILESFPEMNIIIADSPSLRSRFSHLTLDPGITYHGRCDASTSQRALNLRVDLRPYASEHGHLYKTTFNFSYSDAHSLFRDNRVIRLQLQSSDSSVYVYTNKAKALRKWNFRPYDGTVKNPHKLFKTMRDMFLHYYELSSQEPVDPSKVQYLKE